MSQKRQRRRSGQPTPLSDNITDTAEHIAPWRQDWHEPLTAEDRADIDVLVAAAERGFRLATRCTACGAWISNPISIRRHLGPVCAKRAAAS
jgi:hypothetical protein